MRVQATITTAHRNHRVKIWPAGRAHCAWGDHSVVGIPLWLALPLVAWKEFCADQRKARAKPVYTPRSGLAKVFFGLFLLELVLDIAPDGVAGFGGGEEAFGVFGDGFKIVNEGGAVGVVLQEGLEPGVGADVAVSVREEIGQVFLEVCRGHGVEIWEIGVGHTATSLRPLAGVEGSGWRSNSRSLRRALCSWDLLLPV